MAKIWSSGGEPRKWGAKNAGVTKKLKGKVGEKKSRVGHSIERKRKKQNKWGEGGRRRDAVA